jgi:hypothetical protein
MANQLEQVLSYFSPIFVEHASQQLDEEPVAIARCINGMAASILTSVIQQSEDPHTMQAIYHHLQLETPDSLPDLSTLLHSGNLAKHDPRDGAGHLLGVVLGDKTPAVMNAISSFAGTKPGSTSALLGVVGAVVLRVLGKQIQREQLSVSGFSNLLHIEEEKIRGLLPPGVATLIGVATSADRTLPPESSAIGLRWARAFVLLLALAAALLAAAKWL